MRKTTKKAAVAAFIAVCLTAGMTLPVPFGGEIGTVVYADGETTPDASTVIEVSTEAQLRVAVFSGATGTVKLMNDIKIAESDEDKAQIKAEIVDLLKVKYGYSDATASTQADSYLTKYLNIHTADNLVLDLNYKTISRDLSDLSYDGRVIRVTGGKVTIKNGTISGGRMLTEGGGGILGDSAPDITLEGIRLIDNETAVWGGGLFMKDGGSLTMIGCTVENNSAINSNQPAHGGGIYFTGTGAALTLKGGNTFKGNSADNMGGGIYFNGASFDLTDGLTIDGNSAGSYGGGFYYNPTGQVANNSIELGSSVKIMNNTAAADNSPICNGGGMFAANTSVTINGATITGNKAKNGGGGIYMPTSGANLTMIAGDISNNIAGQDGGGIYSSNAGITINGGTVSGNTAAGNGGGIYSSKNITLNNDPHIYSNTDSNGKPNNLYLDSGLKIINNGQPFSSTAEVGITMAAPGVFTDGFSFGQKNKLNPFVSDDPQYTIYAGNREINISGSNQFAAELALMPAADPVESGIKKVKFVWKQDGTCDFYTSEDGQNYGEPAPANVEGSTATMTVEGKTYTSVKPGSSTGSIENADVKVTYDNDNGSYTMTLTIVCDVTKNGDQCLVGVGFDVTDLSGVQLPVFEKTGFASWSAKYSVKFNVSGQGVVVKPYALVKDVDKLKDDTVSPTKTPTDTWGTFYPAS